MSRPFATAYPCALLLALLGTAGCGSGAGRPVVTPSATNRQAVTYIEHQQGPGVPRTFQASAGFERGIDINSRVEINIDPQRLRSALGTGPDDGAGAQRVRRLSTRVSRLNSAAKSLETAIQSSERLAGAWADAERTGDFAPYRTQLEQAARALSVVDTLREAIRDRIADRPGMTPARAEGEADELIATVMDDPRTAADDRPGTTVGYHWGLIRELFAAEIDSAQAALQAVPVSGLEVEIRAHRISASDGTAVAIRLPKYNTEQEGPSVEYQKVQMEVSPEQQQLYARYDSMRASIRSARGAGEAVLVALRTDYEFVRKDVEGLFATAETAVRDAGGALGNLRSITPDQLTAWVQQGLANASGPEADRVRAAVAGLEMAIVETKQDLELLTAYRDVSPRLKGLPADQAMSAILSSVARLQSGYTTGVHLRTFSPEVWQSRAGLVQELIAALGALPNAQVKSALQAASGPFDEISAALAGMEKARDAVRTAGGTALQWVRKLLGSGPAVAASGLPVPAGQQRLPAAGDPSTSFDLRTIPAGRNENDRVRVQYAFYRDGQPTAAGWTDEFVIRSYGWNARAVASLGFTTPSLDGNFQPTPALSWMASYRNWPADSDTGVRNRFWHGIGVGVSTMSLDSDSTETVELGLAPTLGFLGNRVLLGYGYNLQSDSDRWFYFFSLRLFSASGSLDPR